MVRKPQSRAGVGESPGFEADESGAHTVTRAEEDVASQDVGGLPDDGDEMRMFREECEARLYSACRFVSSNGGSYSRRRSSR